MSQKLSRINPLARSLSFALLTTLLLLSLAQASAKSPAPARRSTKEEAASHFARLDGQRIHYKSYGKGSRALVFVHGWTCDLNVWRQQIPAFSNRMRVVALDLPGHGLSDKPQINYSQELFARAVEAVLRDAGVKQAVLVGHSMGTPVVRQFYRRYPEKTLALVFVDGALRPFGKPEDREKFLEMVRGAQFEKVAAGMVDGMLAPVKDEQLRGEIRKTMLSTPKHVAVSAMEGMNAPEIFRDDKINVPAQAILARSPFWAADTEQFFRSLAPNLEYQMWDGVGHFLMVEKPQEFNQALTAFLLRNRFIREK